MPFVLNMATPLTPFVDSVPLLICQQGDGSPIRLEVTLSPSDELLSLRSQVSDLQHALDLERADRKRTEFKYSCEASLRMQLVDYLRDNGISFPKRFSEVF